MPLGQKLIAARQKKALTEEQVSEETCIPLAIIRSLEVDDYSRFDSPVYAKSFLKTYSRFLDLNISEVLVRFDTLASESETIFKANRQPLADTARPNAGQRSRNPLILAPVLVGIFGFLCFSLFSLVTGGSLPFAPAQEPVGEPRPAAAQIMRSAPLPDRATEIAPRKLPKTSQVTLEGSGAYVDDFHASTRTVFLRKSGSEKAQVLP